MKKLKLNIQMFAISNSNSTTLTSSAGNKATLSTSFVENSTNVTNNTSNVTITATLKMTSGSFSVSSNPTLQAYWHDNYNNSDVLISTITINSLSSGGSNSASGTVNVTHNNDGSLSGYSFAVWTYSGSTKYVPRSGRTDTSNTALTTIPRASSVSCPSSANIGTKPTITITSAVSTFTHKLYYEFGNITSTLITDTGLTGNTTITYNNWTIPNTFYAQIPDVKKGNCSIICETYNGETLIGTSTTSFEAVVPATAKPTIGTVTIEDLDTVSKNTIQEYVANKSKLKFTFPEFSSNYNTNLKNYILKINNGIVYTGTNRNYTMPSTLGNYNYTYELIITDTRGISNTTGSQNLNTVYSYTNPTCSINVERDSTTPTTVTITYSGSINNINNNNRNTKSFLIEYKTSTSSTWNNVDSTVFPITNSYSVNSTFTLTNVSDSNSYDFRITATDSYSSVKASTQIGTTFTLINWKADGTGIAFGKASETTNTFEVALKTDFQDDITINGDPLLEAVLDAICPVGAGIIGDTSANYPSVGTWQMERWEMDYGGFLIVFRRTG